MSIKINKIELTSFKDNLLSSFPFLQNWKKKIVLYAQKIEKMKLKIKK